MSRFRFAVLLLLVITTGYSTSLPASQARVQSQSNVEWVKDVLMRMQTVKIGMTRNDLLKTFTTEGGISTGLQRTFISRDCPYFKVDVEFQAVGRPSRDRDGRVTLEEDGRDIIVRISKPYLEFAHTD
jgi:hypothetical protein